uniref:Uncharacterized protein n=1 Tax=Oryza meridionalis TaxID=40149 RepID=A0A0E0E472_9ORYZ
MFAYNRSFNLPSPLLHLGTLGGITNLTPIELRRKRDRERYAALGADDKEARLQKMREYYQRKKSTEQTYPCYQATGCAEIL